MKSREQPRLLVVDDDHRLIAQLKSNLSERGFSVGAETSGARAISLAGSNIFDVLVLDLGLPGENAELIYEKIKEIRPAIELIIITGQEELLKKFDRLVQMAKAVLKKGQSGDHGDNVPLDEAIEASIAGAISIDMNHESFMSKVIKLLAVTLFLALLALTSTNPLIRFSSAMCATLLGLEGLIWAFAYLSELREER